MKLAVEIKTRSKRLVASKLSPACAIGFKADQLHFLTDVDGVRGTASQVIPTLTIADCEELIRDGVATGGMQAKLNAASDALRGGIGQVIIAPGALAGACGRLLAGESVGSRLVAASHA